jgi:diguanylate cyclase
MPLPNARRQPLWFGGATGMSSETEISLRGPEAYLLAHKAVEAMERHQVWPTPLNFELWIHYVGDPQGALALEISRLMDAGETITESVSEALAARYLPKARLNDEIRDAGDQLTKELENVSRAIETAQQSSEAYSQTLAGATKELSTDTDAPELREMIETLSAATRRVQAENGALQHRLSESTQEVGRLREHLEQVRRDAMTDGLTNLANRKAFDEKLAKVCAEAEAAGEAVTLAVVDIDHFKRFNDTWGHQTGDQVLRYVASVIGRVGEDPRLAARYGGEEFAVLFPSETTVHVRGLLENVREEIASRTLKRRSTNQDLGAVTISIGLAERFVGESGASLVERADAALYASKHAGRNRITEARAMDTAA